MNNYSEDEEKAIDKVNSLRDTPVRSAENVSKGKAAYLAKAAEIRKSLPARSAKRSIFAGIFATPVTRKLGALPTLLIVLALLFGGTGVSVVAAQSAQPQDALYSVKLKTEDFAYHLKPGPAAVFNYCLQLTQRRVNEIVYSTEARKTLPEITSKRLMAHIDEAVLNSSELTDAEMLRDLERLQIELKNQLKRMETLQTDQETRMEIQKILDNIQARIDTISNNSTDLNEFRIRIKNGKYEAEIEVEEQEYEDQNKFDHDGSNSGKDDQPEIEGTDEPKIDDKNNSGSGSSSDDSGSGSDDSSGSNSGSGSSPDGSGSGSHSGSDKQKTPKPG